MKGNLGISSSWTLGKRSTTCVNTTRPVRSFMTVQAARSYLTNRIRTIHEPIVSCSSLQINTTQERTLLVQGSYSSPAILDLSTWIDFRHLPELSILGCIIVRGGIESCTLFEHQNGMPMGKKHSINFVYPGYTESTNHDSSIGG